MNNGEKKSRWFKSLDDAGFIDEIEDTWSLPDDQPISEATIRVEGTTKKGDLPEGEPSEGDPPFAVPIPSDSPPPEGQDGSTLPKTPVEPADGAGDALEDIGREVKVRGEKISIPPDADSLEPYDLGGAILDEPPDQGVVQTETEKNQLLSDLDLNGADMGGREGGAEHLGELSENEGDLRLGMRTRFDVGDYTGALELAEKILETDGGDQEALDCRKSCHDTLIQMYESRIGPFDRAPKQAIDADEIIWRNLDAQSGFILSRVDGFISFQDIIDISGLPRFDTCRILNQLLLDGIIE